MRARKPAGRPLFSVVVIAAALLWAMPLLYHVPQAVLASVVMMAISGCASPGLSRCGTSRASRRSSRWYLLLTIATSPSIYWGVLAGLLVSLATTCTGTCTRASSRSACIRDGSLRDRHLWNLSPLAPPPARAAHGRRAGFRVRQHAGTRHLRPRARPDLTDACLFAQPIDRIDITGAEVFGASAGCGNRRRPPAPERPQAAGAQVLERAGLLAAGPMLFVYRTYADALAALTSQAA